MKKPTVKPKHQEAHSSSSPMGMGEMMGSGNRNPSMKIKEGLGKPVSLKKLKTPPKSLA